MNFVLFQLNEAAIISLASRIDDDTVYFFNDDGSMNLDFVIGELDLEVQFDDALAPAAIPAPANSTDPIFSFSPVGAFGDRSGTEAPLG